MARWTRRAFVGALASGAAACATKSVFLPATSPSTPRFPPDARLLIVNLDDLGLLHSVDAAAVTLFDQGPIVSGSAMAACPWFPEIVDYAKARPGPLDLGLHFTFTSEGAKYRWGPVLGASAVPSLVDGEGYFPRSWEPDRTVDLSELDAEMRAQLDRATAIGFQPTHLDCHQHCLQWRGARVFDLLVRVARERRLPIRAAKNWLGEHPYLERWERAGGVLLDRAITIPPETPPERWADWYAESIRNLKPGLTELFLHPGYDDGELKTFSPDRPTWGAAWRQRDLDAMQAPEVQQALRSGGVTLVRWSDVRSALVSPPD